VEIKVGDIYIRHSDEQICRVEWIGHGAAVLESEDRSRLRLIDIFDLERAYTKKQPKFPQ